MSDSPAFLSDVELDVVFFVERFHATMGEAPTDAQILQRYILPDGFLDGFKKNPLVLKSFKARGITYPAPADQFTPEQMHAAAAMLDYADRRSDEKKLRDIGVTTRQWSQWLMDDNFAEYLRSRSERMLSNSMHEAHKGLVKGIRNGNVASIKTYYEITGRHDPNKESQVNVGMLLHTFIEVIQRYVKDPITLHAMATELSNIASRESVTNGLANGIGMGMGAMTYARPAINGSAIRSSDTLTAPKFEVGDDDGE